MTITPRRNWKRLEEVFPDAIIGKGIFSFLDKTAVPWKGDVESSFLDLQYHVNRSGEKIISPILQKFLKTEDQLSDESLQKIANMIFVLYDKSWTKLYDTLSLEYNPIDNYNMVENEETDSDGTSSTSSSQTRTDDLTHSKTGDNTDTESGTVGQDISKSNTKTLDLTQTKTGTNTDKQSGEVGVDTTDGGTVSVVGKGTADNQNNIYGFNSAQGVPSDTSSSQDSSNTQTTNNLTGSKDTDFSINMDKSINETVKDTGTDKDAGTEKHDETRNLTFGHKVSETLKDTGTVSNIGKTDGSDQNHSTRQLTRKGNIGVTTSQQMIQSERDLWLWTFFEQVFKDVDSVLTLSIY